MKKKASNFKLLPSQKIKILHTQKLALVFSFADLPFIFIGRCILPAKVLFETASQHKLKT